MTAPFADADGVIVDGSPEGRLVERLIEAGPADPPALVAMLRADGVPPAAVAPIAERLRPALAADVAWMQAVADGHEQSRRLGRAAVLAHAALAPFAGHVALLEPALGRMWSSDVDVLVAADVPPQIDVALRAAGCITLDDLLARIGREDPDVDRYAVIDGTDVLGALELCRRAYDDGPRAEQFIARSIAAADGGPGVVTPADLLLRRAGKTLASRRVTLRAVLELRALDARDHGGARSAIVARAFARIAELERAGGLEPSTPAGPQTRPWTDRHWVTARARSVRREARRSVRPRAVQVVLSGIDGAGKSTQVERLAANLARVNVTRTTAWVRLGFTGSPLLSVGARIGQRVLPGGSHSAHVARSTGTGEATPVTRRGIVGWTWALAVTLDFIRASRRAVRRARGSVGIFDRALLDAEIGLDHDYAGALELRFHHRLLQRLMRRPDATFYLRIPGDVAYDRKEDMFSREVLVGMVARYDAFMTGRPGVVIVDAQDAPEVIALIVLRQLAAGV